MTRPRTALVALAVLAAAPATAAATPPWSSPRPVADGEVRDPRLAFAPAGRLGVASVRFGGVSSRLLSLRPGETAPAGVREVSTIEDGPHPYARTRTLVLRRTGTAQETTLGVSFGRQDGALGEPRTLRRIDLRPGEAELAVSPAGHAVLAFAEERRGSTRVWLATRRPGSGRFSAPRVVRGRGSARSLAVSVNDRGRFVLAYVLGAGRTRTVEARLGSTRGALGRVQTAGDQLGLARLDAVVAATGRVTLAWTTRDGGEEQDEPTQLRTNVALAGRDVFAGQTLLDRAAPGAVFTEPAPPSLAAAPDGTTAVGWTLSGRLATAGPVNAITPARVSVQDARGRFGPPQQLAEDGVVGRIAARSDGAFAVPVVLGVPLEGGPSRLVVARRGAGAGRFAEPEEVAEDAGAESAVAFGPGPGAEAYVLYVRAGRTGAALSRTR